VCVFFQLWSFENYTSKFRPQLRHKISCSFAPSPCTHLLLPSSSYPWLPMVVSLFFTHLLLEVGSPIIFIPSLFQCHWSSRSKGLHWWRRSKAYKLHMELRHNRRSIFKVSTKSSSYGLVCTWLTFHVNSISRQRIICFKINKNRTN